MKVQNSPFLCARKCYSAPCPSGFGDPPPGDGVKFQTHQMGWTPLPYSKKESDVPVAHLLGTKPNAVTSGCFRYLLCGGCPPIVAPELQG